jgi:deazaflavin-dependent oxidoreductase (nitroreductase family)
MPPMDEVAEQLAGWGKVARLRTRGRRSGRPLEVAVGYVEEPDGSILVAAGATDADWALNLEADPRCVVVIGKLESARVADRLNGVERGRAVRELILHYGTPAERLGAGPAFRLRPTPA